MQAKSRVRVAIISPERILPGMYGGGLRTVSIALELAKEFEVSVFVPHSAGEITQAIAGNDVLSSITWHSLNSRPKGRLMRFHHSKWNGKSLLERFQRYRWKNLPRGWWFGPLYKTVPTIRAHLYSQKVDVLIIEHTRHAETLRAFRKLPNLRLVVNSQNVESSLINQMMQDESCDKRFVNNTFTRIRRYESRITKYCDRLWACSGVDRDRYVELGFNPSSIDVIANPVDTRRITVSERSTSSNKTIVFIGTLCYEPNVIGIVWFVNHVWSKVRNQFPGIKLLVVGAAPTRAVMELQSRDSSIEVHADVASTLPFLECADVSICPLFSGGGTRLKLLEAFSAGVPVVSTTIGAEGIECSPEAHLLVADSEEAFVAQVCRILTCDELAEALRRSGRQLAEQYYDVRVVGQCARTSVKRMLAQEK